MVQQCRLARRLGAKDGYEVVVEPGIGHVGYLQVGVQIGAAKWVSLSRSRACLLTESLEEPPSAEVAGERSYALELLVSVNNLNAMFILELRRLVADRSKVSVHIWYRKCKVEEVSCISHEDEQEYAMSRRLAKVAQKERLGRRPDHTQMINGPWKLIVDDIGKDQPWSFAPFFPHALAENGKQRVIG